MRKAKWLNNAKRKGLYIGISIRLLKDSQEYGLFFLNFIFGVLSIIGIQKLKIILQRWRKYLCLEYECERRAWCGAMEEQKFKKKYIISATSVPAYWLCHILFFAKRKTLQQFRLNICKWNLQKSILLSNSSTLYKPQAVNQHIN